MRELKRQEKIKKIMADQQAKINQLKTENLTWRRKMLAGAGRRPKLSPPSFIFTFFNLKRRKFDEKPG